MLGIFQFDAASVPLLQRLAEEGRLPTLAGLRARGQWIDLETPATHFPAAAYFTLYSGMGVADHGQYHLFQWKPEDQRVRWREDFPTPSPVWERLSAADKKVLVIDAYEATRPKAIHGIALSGWQFVNVFSLPRWCYPDSALSELSRLFGRPKRLEEVFGRPSARSLIKLRRLLLDATDRVVDAALYLMRRESFDLVWVTFLASHLGGHMLWNLSQIDAGSLDDETRLSLEHALTDIYERIDAALGRVIAALPDEADVILVAPSGMGENMIRVDLLPGMLESVLSDNNEAAGSTARAESRSEAFLWRLRAAVPTSARAKAAALLHGKLTREITMRLTAFGVDWSKTPAFVLPSDHFGQIRLNIRGREREGIVDPGDANALMEQIRAGLLSFRDPGGAPAVAAVDRPGEIFGEGRLCGQLPDLVVRWDESSSDDVDHVTSPRHGEVQRFGSGSGRSGAHLPQAWAIITPGSSVPLQSDRPSVIDIVPTICSVLGIDRSELPGTPLLAPR